MPTLRQRRDVAPTRHVRDAKHVGIEIEHDGRLAQRLVLATDDDEQGDGLWSVTFGLLDDQGEVAQTRTLTLDPRDALSPRTGERAFRAVNLPGRGVPLDRVRIVGEQWVSPWKLLVVRALESGWTVPQAQAWLRARQGDGVPAWLPSRLEWLSRVRAGERAKIENPWATPALEQTTTEGNSASITFSASPTEDNLMVCCRANNDSTAGTLPSGWSSAVSLAPYSNHHDIDYKVVGASESSTQTWSGEGANKPKIGREWSGLESSSPLDQTATNTTSETGDGLSISTGTTAALSQNDELAVAVLGRRYSTLSISSRTAGWSGTEVYSGGAGEQEAAGDGYFIVSDGAAQSCTFTGNLYTTQAGIATFKASAAAAATIPASRRSVAY